jgi:hypothetical protein
MAKEPKLSDHDKEAIRKWMKSKEPMPSWMATVDWFEAQTGRQVSASTIRYILDQKYRQTQPASALVRARKRSGIDLTSDEPKTMSVLAPPAPLVGPHGRVTVSSSGRANPCGFDIML